MPMFLFVKLTPRGELPALATHCVERRNPEGVFRSQLPSRQGLDGFARSPHRPAVELEILTVSQSDGTPPHVGIAPHARLPPVMATVFAVCTDLLSPTILSDKFRELDAATAGATQIRFALAVLEMLYRSFRSDSISRPCVIQVPNRIPQGGGWSPKNLIGSFLFAVLHGPFSTGRSHEIILSRLLSRCCDCRGVVSAIYRTQFASRNGPSLRKTPSACYSESHTRLRNTVVQPYCIRSDMGSPLCWSVPIWE